MSYGSPASTLSYDQPDGSQASTLSYDQLEADRSDEPASPQMRSDCADYGPDSPDSSELDCAEYVPSQIDYEHAYIMEHSALFCVISLNYDMRRTIVWNDLVRNHYSQLREFQIRRTNRLLDIKPYRRAVLNTVTHRGTSSGFPVS